MARWKRTEFGQDQLFEKKRCAVLKEAGRSFAKRGFHNTSLDDVAAALGVTKAALYTYVNTKREILFECHRESMDLGDAALAEALALKGSAAKQLERFLIRYIEYMTGDGATFAILSEIEALAPKDRAVIADRRDRFEARFVELLNSGLKDGSLDFPDAKVAVFVMMGTLHWMVRWFDPAGRLSSEEMAVKLSATILQGLASRPRPPKKRA